MTGVIAVLVFLWPQRLKQEAHSVVVRPCGGVAIIPNVAPRVMNLLHFSQEEYSHASELLPDVFWREITYQYFHVMKYQLQLIT